MSLRLSLALLLLVGCGGETMKVRKGEPQTAREKMMAEEKAHPSDADDSGTGKKWSGWRYQGDRIYLSPFDVIPNRWRRELEDEADELAAFHNR